MEDSPFTDEELGVLYRHGTRGFIYNAERAAQKEAIEEWKSDDQRHEELRAFNEVFDMSYIVLDTSLAMEKTAPLQPGLDVNEAMFKVTEESPFDGPGMQLKRVGDKLARDVSKYFERELARLLENSTLSKQQFVVFVLLWEEPSEHGTGRQLGERGVAEALDLAIGTVRSHHARAKDKIEKAEFTAGLTDYAVADWNTTHEDTKALLDEKL
ncbi:hypothetical protein [Natrinema limicola]|uniref:Uncharacterized protein n=1 Tax=Natrinema limicola JCM 13563 TaxID=1230457 RepID=M0C0X3_9EURY|nr:hypothetical protein [Natrinema limicola]ELZ15977.1 hypothetical protein C476_17207 [Natrinema limicola JCM 13563]